MNWADVPREPEAYDRFVTASRQEALETAKTLEPNFAYDNRRELGNITPADRDAGAIPFVRSYLVPQFEESVPTDAERTTTVSVRAARGEVEPVSFGLYALTDLEGVHAEMGDWEDEPAGQLDVRCVECAPVRHGASSSSLQWQMQPVRLWPISDDETFSIPAKRSLQFWATLRVPKEASPGTRTISISVLRGRQLIYTLTIKVDVLPFDLPPAEAAFGVYEAASLSDAEMADLVDHGCNSASMWARWPKYEQGSGRYDIGDLDAYLAKLKASGLGHSWVWYVATKSHERFAIGEEIGEEGIRLLLQQLNTGVASGRYPRNVSLTIDEAVCNYAQGSRGDQSVEGTVGNRWHDFVDMMAWMKEDAPELKRFGVSLNRHEDALLHDGHIDILSCNGSFPENGAWCARNGLSMYTYGSFNKGTYPAQSRYNTGFYPWFTGADGTFCWAYKWSMENPFNDFDGKAMDWMLAYPGPGDTLISTPAWEAWREGVEDRRYLEMYEHLVKAGDADGALLDGIRHSLSPDSFMEETVVGDSSFGAVVDNHTAMTRARDELQTAIVSTLC